MMPHPSADKSSNAKRGERYRPKPKHHPTPKRLGNETQCPSGKHGYATKEFAKTARKRMAQRGRGKLSVYWCHRCNYWHLGHLPEDVKRGNIPRSELTPKKYRTQEPQHEYDIPWVDLRIPEHEYTYTRPVDWSGWLQAQREG